MPANLTPEYYAAEAEYREAATDEEKIEALQKMLQVIPKHKGTEKMQGELKKRLSQLRKKSSSRQKKIKYNPFHVEKQGAGQVVLVGYPNAGKSFLVNELTRARQRVADYPYATPVPAAGMMPYENIQVQLVDTPPLTREVVPSGLWGTLKNADALLLVIDSASPDCLEQLEGCLELLRERHLIKVPPDSGRSSHPYLVVAAKTDHPDSAANLEVLRELYPHLKIMCVGGSAQNRKLLGEEIFKLVDVIRIYSKAPGKAVDFSRPFILKRGSTVLDFAYQVHRDFPSRLKTAFVWGSTRFEGQPVAKDYVLADGDAVELQV